MLKTPLECKECFSLTRVSIYDSPNFVSDNGLFQLGGETALAYSQHQFDRPQKGARYLLPLVFLRDESWSCFGIGNPRVFLRAAPTVISKRFVKPGTIKYHRT